MNRIEAGLQAVWQRRGAAARLLWPASLVYGAVVAARRRRPAAAPDPAGATSVPVIVVGNLVAGGAGKTPTVLALAALLTRHGWSPGIVSRGHGRRPSHPSVDVTPATAAADCGDEPLLLRRRSGCPVVVDADRPRAVRALLRRHGRVDVVLSDDGLQHLALARTLQVLVFDERGIGNGWLLPAGPLREPFRAQPPAHSLVLYNAAAPTTAWPGAVAVRRIAGAVRLADWWQGRPASPQALRALAADGATVVAVAGTARPGRYFEALAAAGLRIEPLALPDHHPYATLPWKADGRTVLVTEKDAVKLAPERPGTERVWVVPLDFLLPDEFGRDVITALAPWRGQAR